MQEVQKGQVSSRGDLRAGGCPGSVSRSQQASEYWLLHQRICNKLNSEGELRARHDASHNKLAGKLRFEAGFGACQKGDCCH